MNSVLVSMNTGILQNLGVISCPAGLGLIPGGTRNADLPFSLPPDVRLGTHDPSGILAMLDYAGIHYRSPNAPAASFGVNVFQAARDFARQTFFDQITFDWDHTLSNYKIFDNVWHVAKTYRLREPPPEAMARLSMTAIEVARPFMHELAFGLMVGYAERQGLRSLAQWTRYDPQVGIVTHTWPDRIGVLGRHYMPLIPLMEGLLPGSPRMYEKITDEGSRSIVHLHHFLDYAQSLITAFDRGGFEALKAGEQDEVMAYCKDGRGHYLKPIGALALRGWAASSLLHFEDSTQVVADIEDRVSKKIRAIHVRQPHSNAGDIKLWNKIAVSGLWRSRQRTAESTIRDLARMEARHSTISALLAALGAFKVFSSDLPDTEIRAPLPEGVLLMVHETPTTLGKFWRYYVKPTNDVKDRIRQVVKRRGGLTNIRKDYERIRLRRTRLQLVP